MELELDEIMEQWKRVRPDLDPEPMGICGDIWRVGGKLKQGVLANLTKYDLDFAAFDVLLTLRRQGSNQALTPAYLAKEMMLSTSAMTNRIDRLEKRALVTRSHDPEDRRSLKISLTEAGFKLADEVVTTHVATEEELIKGLTKEERITLRLLLSKITA
ncbi:MarR family winged helix-turn-helix transcriptional regulator [Flexibacterium corallicola]|uniref:MarR family winged helix-turn-helix transcriptional regulator n=1 Tax=Flexibacterium corallicola TaxID=3037259 RepID=UPI00286FA8D7|nr:MarR family transcriptional regulator [Pseudovibrio sp. M1P-2-3]